MRMESPEARKGFPNKRVTYYPTSSKHEDEVTGIMLQREGCRYLFDGDTFWIEDPRGFKTKDIMNIDQIAAFLNRVDIQIGKKRKFRTAIDRVLKVAQNKFEYIKEREFDRRAIRDSSPVMADALFDPQQNELGLDR